MFAARKQWMKSPSAMRLLCAVLVILSSGLALRGGGSGAQPQKRDFGLPELHKIFKATLSPSYGCRSPEEFKKGYEHTALFLSRFSKEINGPELLFQGACRGEDSFQVEMAGDNMSLIADLGEIELEHVTMQQVFHIRGLHFERTQAIQLKHTYAVIVNDRRERGLFLVAVTGHIPNERLDLKYAVKDLQILNVDSESSGFDWDKHNLE